MMPLFGHDAAVAAFRAALDSGRLHHAWLIAGPPGIGKTSLAIQASLDLNDRDPPPGGIWWVMLRDAVTRREVLRVLTEALPALVDPSRAERHADDIGAWLSRQPPMLLVLDHADTCAAPLAAGRASICWTASTSPLARRSWPISPTSSARAPSSSSWPKCRRSSDGFSG